MLSGACNLPASSGDQIAPVLVLARAVTGLDVVRALGRAGIRSHAIYFDPDDPVRLSRYCSASLYNDPAQDEQALLRHIIAVALQLGGHPIVVPCCDAHVLMLAKHRSLLDSCCRVAAADYDDLIEVVSKERLYAHAADAGLDTIPAILSPGTAEAHDWSLVHPAPYLAKPYYVGIPSSRLKLKNLTFDSREALLKYVATNDMTSLIVQKLVRGGDGYIFDCYGYCGRDGKIVDMTTKRRWHQEPPDFGTCSLGEIPAYLDAETAEMLMANTRRLFAQIRYHGIFGVEWLCDRETHKFYLIDFNARPFMSVAHVAAAGLNLPALQYADLSGSDVRAHMRISPIKHLYGLDLLRDLESLLARRQSGEGSIVEWWRKVAKCRYFYYASWRDPLPGIARFAELLRHTGRYLRRLVSDQHTQAGRSEQAIDLSNR